jgi:glycine/D-amino acid oxidase-like deaminating enzyme
VHIVVIGAGAFGAWAAHHLHTARFKVTLVDAYGPANARASSGDESRIIRCGYGPDAIYSTWARRSLGQWRALFDRVGRHQVPLFHQCGVLWLASGDDAYTRATLATLERDGHVVERLDRTSLETRFPHITAEEDVGLFEAECGVLMARRAVQLLVADLTTRGVDLVRAHVMSPDPAPRLAHVQTADGRRLAADAFVFACGPWLPKVFPALLSGRIRPTRQVVIYFGVPPGDARFGPEGTPAWVDFPAGIYGVPDLEQRGLKVGVDRHGPPFDPDHDDRVADMGSIETARQWLARRMPMMSGAPVNETRVCQYENTANGDFLIDRHPELENVWIAGGGSGHGFKHAPAVGEHVAALVQGAAPPEPRFTLAAKGTQPQRSVY